MKSTEEVLRAQARALIDVLGFYGVEPDDDQHWRFWRAIEAFGQGIRGSRGLATIHLDFYDVAWAAAVAAPRYKVRDYLTLALFAFCENRPIYRFREPAKSIARAVVLKRENSAPNVEMEGEVFERLEDAFDAKIFQTVPSKIYNASRASVPNNRPAVPGPRTPSNGLADVDTCQLKLTGALYATSLAVMDSVKITGQLPTEISPDVARIGINQPIRERGSAIALTADEQLVFDAIIRSRRLPGGRIILASPAIPITPRPGGKI